MAYLDVVSQENQVLVNTKAIKLFGRDTAIYLSVILSAYSRVKDKHTYDDEGFWNLKRSYVSDKIQMTVSEQLSCDEVLSKVGILEHADSSNTRLRINMQELIALLTCEDTSLLASLVATSKAMTKEEKSASKKRGQIMTMQRICEGLAGCKEVSDALNMWVEALYENKKYLTKDLINLFWQNIVDYTTDVDKQIDIIKTATINCWRDSSWVINKTKPRSSLDNRVDLSAPIKY